MALIILLAGFTELCLWKMKLGKGGFYDTNTLNKIIGNILLSDL